MCLNALIIHTVIILQVEFHFQFDCLLMSASCTELSSVKMIYTVLFFSVILLTISVGNTLVNEVYCIKVCTHSMLSITETIST